MPAQVYGSASEGVRQSKDRHPLDANTDGEITLLANLITLTPGTLSFDLSKDRRTLYVHAMFVDSPESVRDTIKSGFERRLLELTR